MPEPLYRKSFDANALLREHPPKFHHPHKRLLFDLAFLSNSDQAGEIEVTRWGQQNPPRVSFGKTSITIQPNFFDYVPAVRSGPALEWHVNFADPRLFAAYGSGLFAQDEMQVAEHPILACVREALLADRLEAMTSDHTGATPMLVRNVERRIAVATNPDATMGRPVGLYGNLFAAASTEAIRRATSRIDPPTITNLIAMAAPAGGDGDYTTQDISFIFATAFTAFAAAVAETARNSTPGTEIAVHSGFWGCGAFGGNRKLMVALQVLAARAANVNYLILHTGDLAGIADAERGVEVADDLVSRTGSPCATKDLFARAEMLGYQWGFSDGN